MDHDEGQQEAIGSEIATVANSTGLPTTLRGKAQRWIFRLIGGTVASPVLQKSQETWDQVEGRSRVNMMLAEEVGRRAIADPDLMERAKAHFLSDTFRKQENTEAVAAEAAKILEDASFSTDSDDAVDDDWINIFARYAEDASSEKMRNLWGKVLAGEIRNSGSFSLATLRTISEMDQDLAKDFSRFCSMVVDDCVIRTSEWNRGDLFSLASRLESAGLVTGAVGSVNRITEPSLPRMPIAIIDGKALIGDFPNKSTITYDIILLTRVGRQLLGLQTLGDVDQRLERLALEYKSHGVTRAVIGTVVTAPIGGLIENRVIFGDLNAPPPKW